MDKLNLDGRQYFDWLDDIKAWIKNGEFERAELKLLRIIDFIEENDSEYGVAPAYYEKLAILYSRLKRPKDELDILVRYSKQKHAPGKKAEKLLSRLEDVKMKIKKINNGR